MRRRSALWSLSSLRSLGWLSPACAHAPGVRRSAAAGAASSSSSRQSAKLLSTAATAAHGAPSQQLQAALCGGAAAFTQAAVGIGGGIVLVPALTGVVGLSQLQATGSAPAAAAAARCCAQGVLRYAAPSCQESCPGIPDTIRHIAGFG